MKADLLQFPLLDSGRVRLRTFRADDITDEYLGWLNDPHVTRFSNQRFRTHDARSAQAYLAGFSGQPSHFLSARLANDDRPIGTLSLHVSAAHQTADMGIMLGARDCWGQGYGLEFWKLALNWLLEDLRVRKVSAGTTSVNRGMLQILDRSGMQHEATRRDQELVDGKPVDILHYARFRE